MHRHFIAAAAFCALVRLLSGDVAWAAEQPPGHLTDKGSVAACAVESRNPDVTQDRKITVATFGARGDGVQDDGPAIQKAMDAAIAAGCGAEVLFEPDKIYRLAARTTAASALLIRNAQGLIISGKGATLVGNPSNGLVGISGSRNILMRDLVLDYNPLPFTQAKVTFTAAGTVRFRVEPGCADPAIGDEDIWPDFKNSDAVFLDGTTRNFTHMWARIRSVKAIEAGLFEARFHESDNARRLEGVSVGDLMAIKQNVPHAAQPTRDDLGRYLDSSVANVYIGFSRGVRIERVVSHAAPSMTFVASGSEDVVLDGCKVIRKPGTDRLIAGNSDGAHFKSLTVMPQIRNSVFEALMDDSINIKISAEVVKEVQGARIRLEHGDFFTDDIVVAPGQSLLFLGGPNKRHLGYGKATAVERIGYREICVTLESAVAELAAGDLAFLKPVTDAVVSRCEFQSQLKTALLVYTPAIVSECRFSDVAYGVHAPFPGAIEGPPPSGLRVLQCDFVRPSVAAIALHLPSIDTGAPGRQALVADGCTITMASNHGLVMSAYHQEGVVLRNVQVRSDDGRTKPELITLHECTGIREENVTFAAPCRASAR